MLWGHIFFSLLSQVAGKVLYFTGFTLVLICTELLPFTLISINMVRRLKVYHKAKAASLLISESSQQDNRQGSATNSNAGIHFDRHSNDELNYVESVEREIRCSIISSMVNM